MERERGGGGGRGGREREGREEEERGGEERGKEGETHEQMPLWGGAVQDKLHKQQA